MINSLKLLKYAKDFDDMTSKFYNVVTFDFDNTLIKRKFEISAGFIEIGPNLDTINKLKQYKSNGAKVYIVTSRTETEEGKSNRAKDDPKYRTPVAEFIKEYGLPIDGLYFTNGALKIETLKQLGSELHFDDDPNEVNAILNCQCGIEVVKV